MRVALETKVNLFDAAKQGDVATVVAAQLTRAEADILDAQRMTPLAWATLGGHVEVVDALLGFGANPNRKFKSRTLLGFAAESGSVETVKRVLEAGVDRRVTELDQWTPVHRAARHGHAAVLELLLSKGFPADAPAKGKRTPLTLACQSGHLEAARVLLDARAKVNHRVVHQHGGDCPLTLAAASGSRATVELLLDRGARIDLTNGTALTSLAIAIARDHAEVFDLLVARGADLNAHGDHGAPPVVIAATHGRTDLLERLLDAGVSPDQPTALRGRRPLMAAVGGGHGEAAELLLSRGAVVDQTDGQYGDTALCHAVAARRPAMVTLLLGAGAEVNHRNQGGRTPLFYLLAGTFHTYAHYGTVTTDPEPVVRALLAGGAELGAQDTAGHSVLELAREHQHADVVAALEACAD